ncbi:OsmC family protein [Microbacterium sp. SLBN-146]|uniref:OsmC family protein n=1 Tax=Microbacterium sp. SLBN-146 TaxID=2768457 RepID=UPI0011528E5A|nr:OsmC family protein [Microbacterium sp. SLBN-146]
MSARYRTKATNRDGGTGITRIDGGLAVAVWNPLDPAADPDASNPEQLLALAWSTCLNATAQAIVGGERATAVSVEVELHEAVDRVGYEFHATAFVSAEGLDVDDTRSLAEAAHQRCPISRLLHSATTVSVEPAPYAA